MSGDITQYGHSKWTLRDGGLPGYPRSIAQTRDGFLWLATDFGLQRFDGVRFASWEPPAGSSLPGVVVRLLATRDGSLWIGMDQGLARWNHGVLSAYRELDGQYVYALAEDRDGAVWAGTNGGRGNARLCSIQGETVDCKGDDGALGRFVLSLHEDDAGDLWVGAATGVWRWGPAEPTQYPVAGSPSEINALADDGRGAIVVAMARQLARLVDGTVEPYRVDSGLREVRPTSLLRDRQGGLWIGTRDNGLLYVNHGRTDRFGRDDGLSGNFVVDILEDREGNVWVATLGGLDRFRDIAVGRFSTRQGLSSDTVLSVLATTDGDVWMGTVSGLERWSDGVVLRYAIPGAGADEGVGSLFEDSRGRIWVSSLQGLFSVEPGATRPLRAGLPTRYVHALAEDTGGTLWVSDSTSGLFGLRGDDNVEVVPWSTFGGESARALFADPSGGLWLGFIGGGVSRLENGRVQQTYTSADGLGAGDVTSIHDDREGALWVATAGGLSRIAGGRVDTLGVRSGLPCDAVKWSVEDHTGALWLQTDCGLVRVERDELDEWISDPASSVGLIAYDGSDGAVGYANLGSYGPKVSRAADGHLWFATYDGVGVIDPRALPSNPIPPPVHIERVIGDGTTYAPSSVARLPARVRDVRIEYTALSLGAPDKVAFRYRLEGRDEDWVEAGNRRQAFYNDLPPGTYRFHVIAANDRGVWNEEGAAREFSIASAYYQTSVFRLAVVTSVLLSLTLLHQLRLRHVAAQLNARLQERLDERARVAQTLHDTLFQGFVSSHMLLYAVVDDIADQSARSKLTRVLQRMHQVIEEGRETVGGLRAPVEDNLESALVRDAEYFKGERQIDVRLAIKGNPRPLHPFARDALYQISREALANAFRHARATRVEIDIEYSHAELIVRVRDDGCGIAGHIVAEGRSGHFGLSGMRERAEGIGAVLRIWSRLGSGTEVEIHMPAKTAFPNASPDGGARWWRRARGSRDS